VTLDDDQIRQALSTGTRLPSARRTLEQLRPTMQRARRKRTLAASATAVTLLVGGGISVAALSTTNRPSTTRSVAGEAAFPVATLPPVPSTTVVIVAPDADAPLVQPPPEPMGSTTGAPTLVDDGVAARVEETPAPPPTSSAPASGATPTTAPPPAVAAPPPAVVAPPSVAAPPSAAAPQPVVEAPPVVEPAPPPAIATAQTISSRCGDVVVSVDSGELRIISISPQPGFAERVSDDGPTSIEITFRGSDESRCEVHAELEHGELDVEVQHSGG